MKPHLGVGVAIVAVFVFGGAAAAMPPEEIAKIGLGSTVTVVALDAARRPIGQGTGFFVTESVLVTNAHVMAGAATAVVYAVGSSEAIQVLRVEHDSEHDLALLWTNEARRRPLVLSSSSIRVGQRVFAVGSPHGLEGTVSQGIVSAVRPFAGGLLQIDAAISQGSSGGPLLNEDGQCVGVVVAKHRQGESLNFAIPISALNPFLARSNLASLSAYERPEKRGAEEVMRPVISFQASIGSCLKTEVSRNPDMPGRVTLMWTITADGKAINVELKERQVRDGPLSLCIRETISGMRWSEIRGQPHKVELPLSVKK
jgi:S1-C subfamily serine protease